VFELGLQRAENSKFQNLSGA